MSKPEPRAANNPTAALYTPAEADVRQRSDLLEPLLYSDALRQLLPLAPDQRDAALELALLVA